MSSEVICLSMLQVVTRAGTFNIAEFGTVTFAFIFQLLGHIS